ncbi:hypothetical protein ACEP28_32565 [Pseudomonas aeruginosa]|uniref:hypothetical protein n=1 Tax=Pseudomonadaceae TaxID=135621 RepID=UPI001ADA9DA2|nr:MULTISPECIES: hypothetical protein [Pseudomonas aeruginosa group]MBO8337136.1 hypothetical protein [Pseudomonas aeruginosa]BDC78366.1 hypothetical protein MRCP2_p1010 [Pseudomonas alcaligenes]HCF4080835.1 hypothetical protein [Pseudomonas aeruginosa]
MQRIFVLLFCLAANVAVAADEAELKAWQADEAKRVTWQAAMNGYASFLTRAACSPDSDSCLPTNLSLDDTNKVAGLPAPTSSWTLDGSAGLNPKEAEFAADYAAKLLTVVTRVESTPEGKRAFVIVADKYCIVDFSETHEGFKAVNTNCAAPTAQPSKDQ